MIPTAPHPGSSTSTAEWNALPVGLREAVTRALAPDEAPLAWLLTDVSRDRRFEAELVVLTHQRLISCSPQGQLESWPLADASRLRCRDRAGLGTLELLAEDRRLGLWYYRSGRGPAALALAEQFDSLKSTGALQRSAVEITPPEAALVEPPPNTRALMRLSEFARPHGTSILLGLVCSLASTGASLVPPALVMPLVDDILIPFQTEVAAGLPPGTPSRVSFDMAWWYLGGLVIAAVIAWLLAWAQGFLLARASERIVAGLRDRTYAHLQRLSLEYFGGKRTGDLMSRLSTDSDRLNSFLSDSLVDFISDCLLVVGIALVMVWINPWLALVTLLPFPLTSWLMYRSRDALQQGFASGGRAWAQLSNVLADTIPGIRVVKAFAQEHREIERFHQANFEVVRANDRVNFVWTFFWPMIALVNQLAVILVWGFGVYQVSQQQLEVGVLTGVVAYITRFYGRLEMMSRFVNSSQRAAASAQRIFEVLDRVSSVPEPARPVSVAQIQGDLEFRHVGFRYGNRKVMHDVNLQVRAGEMIGLVGHTGAGKSTLINLVCRFFDVAEGAILVDGIDIRSYKIEDYRRCIGIVLQEPFLFYGTIAENIAYGRPEATREEIVAAARAARAHEFILQLPDGYESIVGERGQSLSGGERQRISIARALLVDPRILILDEATSAVDTQTEREIQDALENLIRGRTTLAIAHRLSTLRKASRIVVLERGRIVEVGTHQELVDAEGTYAGLHRAQQELAREIGW